MSEHVLGGGAENAGAVVRVGNTVRRPRRPGFEVVEALLEHLEAVGFRGAPRLLGIDEHDRQILDYLHGEASPSPSWQQDDEANAVEVGRVAAQLRLLHDATADYDPPAGATPRRPLPVPGEVWTHGDVGYSNLVYRHGTLVGLIDWEFAAPAHPCCDPAALLAVSVRGPRPDVNDNDRRALAVRRAVGHIARNFGMTDGERQALPVLAAMVVEDIVDFQRQSMSDEERGRWQWRATWFREHADDVAAI